MQINSAFYHSEVLPVLVSRATALPNPS